MALALPFFAVTLFVSAFLLFLVQPIIGKMILPRLGGTPQVWNTCMMFFQTALLAGYAYTHTVSTKLTLRRQLIVHSLLLLVPLIVLLPWGPFNVTNWIPPPGANPIFSTLLLLTAVVGIPFFVVATSAPLLQKWFASTGHPAAKDPYFLYAASNLGSMLGLLAYPVIVEPLFRLQAPIINGHVTFDPMSQSWLWALGYMVLVVLVGGCAMMAWKAPPSVQLAGAAVEEPPPAEILAAAAPPPPPVTNIKTAAPRTSGIKRGSKQRGRAPHAPAPTRAAPSAPAEPPAPPRPYQLTFWRRLRWVGLAAVPSSLMLGITTYISTDISAIPLFWVIPLALYLLSFILVFLRWPVPWTDVPHKVVLFLQPLCLLALVFMILQGGTFHPARAISFCLLGFFGTALMCHGELARDRPPTKYLTEFYLWMSVGGMVGGVFNGLIAPIAFTGQLEFYVALIFAGLLRPQSRTENSWLDGAIVSLFPGFGDWVANAGDDLARGGRSQPAAGGETRPLSRRDLPPRGYLLHHTLDVLLPVILGLCMLFVVSKANAYDSWRWYPGYLQDSEEYAADPDAHREALRENLKNPLFRIAHSTLGFNEVTARNVTWMLYYLLLYLIPLAIVFLWYGRPLRFGLGVGAVLLVSFLSTQREGTTTTLLHAERSYFGILKVYEHKGVTRDGTVLRIDTYLMHGTTHHGLNYQAPHELRRLATTYYHKNGPVGAVMRRFDFFAAPVPSDMPSPKAAGDAKEKDAREKALRKVLDEKLWNTYWTDARIPASVVGSALAPMSGSLNPALARLPVVVGAWSDPPYACVGLGTGTMASYSRPFQHMTFYEIDQRIRNFSFKKFEWPERDAEQKGVHWPPRLKDGTTETAPFFNYVHDAMARGARIQVIMGDARLSMKQESPQTPEEVKEVGLISPHRQHYYRAIELDAFSSDAIPVHLITREAIEMYFQKLMKPRDVKETVVEEVEEKDEKGNKVMKKVTREVTKHFSGGVLMVHTSNRHVDLVKPVTDIVKAIGEERAEKAGRPKEEWNKFMAYRVGKDGGDREAAGGDPSDLGRFGSEYVMVAEDDRDLPRESTEEEIQMYRRTGGRRLIWTTPRAPDMRVWTDDFSNMLSVFRW